ncbi:MAG: hypothetical protein JXR05_07790 [Flavobacteriaceae bacterium]
MIKFFRKNRQNMIKDLPTGKAGNKASKYLLYAIGEIILVVIGILIALQINNTNENGKKREIEVNYLERLSIDLKDNEKLWSDFYDVKQKQLEAANIFLNFSFRKNQDSVFQIMPYFNAIFSWVDININQVTFEEMVSSGNLDLISNDSIKIKLLVLNKHYKSILDIQKKEKESHDRLLFPPINEKFNMRYFMALEPTKQKEINRTFTDQEVGYYLNEFKKELIELIGDQTFMNGVTVIQSSADVTMKQFLDAKQQVTELIALIKEELKRD